MAEERLVRKVFSEAQEAEIVSAIQAAERNTSGEIRVHLDEKCPTDAYKRATVVFAKLEMHQTELRNGILFYLAFADKKFAIIGDSGINQKVPENFWNDIRDQMRQDFAAGNFTTGLCKGIAATGEALKAYFPYQDDDINELPDQISTS